MDLKHAVWAGIIVGSFVGGYIPALWGAGMFSISSIIFSGLGSIAGIWVAYKISR